jgi:hypothetical protein
MCHAGLAEARAQAVDRRSARGFCCSRPRPGQHGPPAGNDQAGLWPDGRGTGAAQVLATSGSAAGSVVAVSLFASGKLTRPPLQRGQITAWTIAAAALAPAVLALSLLTAPWPAQHLADRLRLAAWDAVWCTTG